jgi:polar amino acid transport system substrate-binding protein
MKMMMKKISILLLLVYFAAGSAAGQEKAFTISTAYRNLLSNTDKSGMLDRILIEAFRRIGMKAEIVYTPTEKSLVDVNAGLLDAEINRIAGMEQIFPNLVQAPEANMTMHFVAFSNNDFEINGWESIRDLHIGIVKGWKILENNTKEFPNVVYVPTERELFRMLHKNRIDIALYSKLTGYALLHELGYVKVQHLEPPLESREMYLYVHKDHSAVTERIAAALREMKEDGTYREIVEKTTGAVMYVDR